MSEKPKSIVEIYRGDEATARRLFLADAAEKTKEGYYPVSDNWVPGSYGCGSFIVALLLAVILIGIIMFIYMLIVKPAGALTVTYEYRGVKPTIEVECKVCPECAEDVKMAAKKCRFCEYIF